MKKIFLYFFVPALVIISVLAVVLFYSTEKIANHYKPEIEQVISKTLNSNATLGDISVKLFPTLQLAIDQIVLKQNKQSTNGLTLKNVALELSLQPLLKGQLGIKQFVISEPNIKLIQTANGFEIEGLGQAPAAKEADQKVSAKQPKNQSENTQPSAPTISLDALRISDANIQLENPTSKLLVGLNDLNVLANIKVDGNKIELGNLEVDSKLSGTANNIKLAGALQQTGSAKLKLSGDYNSQGKLILDGISAEMPNFNLNNLDAQFDYTAKKESASIKSSALSFNTNGHNWNGVVEANLLGDNLTLSPLNLKACGGNTDLKLDFNLPSKAFKFDMQAKDFNLAELLPALVPSLPTTIEGKVTTATIDLSGAANDSLKSSLKGNGNTELSAVTIKNINIAGRALSAVTNVPFLKASLLAEIPSQYRGIFESPDTVVDLLKVAFSISNQVVNISNLFMQSKLYNITLSGTASFSNQLNMKAQILFEPELSGQLVAKTKELKYLLDSSGRISLPIEISGTLPNIVVVPQLDKLLTNQVENVIKEKATDAINKYLGKLW